MLTDLHNHTRYFSPDATMTIEELIEGARARDIGQIAVTEHYDMDYPHKDEIFTFNLDEYGKTFAKWRAKSEVSGGPELLMGIEIGWQAHLSEKIKETAGHLPFDVIILSNHLFKGSDVYYSKDAPLMNQQDRNREYIGNMARMCREINCFDVAAHYDYINRYIPSPDSFVLYEDCPGEFDELFDALISKEKALEINTRSIDKQLSKGSKFVFPDPAIIKRYMEMGGKLFTLGSDSHSPETIGIHFKETLQYLSELGVREICHFKGRKPYLDQIDTVM